MTNKEAIQELKDWSPWEDIGEKALDMAIKSLEQQPCEDMVDRELVETLLRRYDFCSMDMTIDDFMNELPSVKPQRPKGKWIKTKDDCDGANFYDFSFECTECGKEQSFKFNFCPNCGAEMNEEIW